MPRPDTNRVTIPCVRNRPAPIPAIPVGAQHAAPATPTHATVLKHQRAWSTRRHPRARRTMRAQHAAPLPHCGGRVHAFTAMPRPDTNRVTIPCVRNRPAPIPAIPVGAQHAAPATPTHATVLQPPPRTVYPPSSMCSSDDAGAACCAPTRIGVRDESGYTPTRSRPCPVPTRDARCCRTPATVLHPIPRIPVGAQQAAPATPPNATVPEPSTRTVLTPSSMCSSDVSGAACCAPTRIGERAHPQRGGDSMPRAMVPVSSLIGRQGGFETRPDRTIPRPPSLTQDSPCPRLRHRPNRFRSAPRSA